MPKGKLKRLDGINEAIKEILKKNDHPTTNKIQRLLEDEGFKASWSTVYNYLDEMRQTGEIEGMTFGDEFKVSTWSIPKGVGVTN